MRSFMVTGFMHLDPPKSAAWLAEQDKWMRGMIANHPREEDAFWRHVAYTVAQLDGLHAGYVSAAMPGWVNDDSGFAVLFLHWLARLLTFKRPLLSVDVSHCLCASVRNFDVKYLGN